MRAQVVTPSRSRLMPTSGGLAIDRSVHSGSVADVNDSDDSGPDAGDPADSLRDVSELTESAVTRSAAVNMGSPIYDSIQCVLSGKPQLRFIDALAVRVTLRNALLSRTSFK